MAHKITRGRDSGRVVPSKPREPGEAIEATKQGMDVLPDGEMYLVIRVVRGRVELYKDSLPARPMKRNAPTAN